MRALVGFIRAAALVLALPVLLGARWPEWAIAATEAADLERWATADAVVVLDEWQIQLKGGARTGTRRRVVHVLTEDGRDAAKLALSNTYFERHSAVRMWIRQPGGETSRFGDDDGTLFGVSSFNTLDDAQLLMLDPPGLAVGSTIAMEYGFEHNAERPQDLFVLQGDAPVARARISIDCRGGFSARARVAHGPADAGPAYVRETGTWEFRDLPALAEREHPSLPAPPALELALNYAPPGGASPFETWSSTATWASALYALDDRSRPALDAAVAALRSSGQDVVEGAGRIARRTRYYAVELDWGGYIPRPPEKTLERSLGDCKDKAQLMRTLLRGAGIEAYPVLVIAPSYGHVPEELPSAFVFNHAIVGIPWAGRETLPGMTVVNDPDRGALRLYDATLSDSSPDDISPMLLGGAALVAHPGTTRLLRLPGGRYEDNLLEHSVVLKLAPDGAVSVSGEHRARGAQRSYFTGEHGDRLRRDELRQLVYERLSRVLPTIDALEVDELSQAADGTWSFAFRASSASPLLDFGSVQVFEPGSLMRLDAFPLPEAGSELPSYLPLLGVVRESWTVEHEGRASLALTPALDESNDLGRVRLATAIEPQRLRIERELAIATLEVPASRREQLLALRTALRKANAAAALLEQR